MLQDFKSILKHGSIYSLGNILSKLVGFLMIPLYTTYLTPADYGVIELLTLASVVISMVLAFRLSSGLTRFYREYQDEENRNRLISTSMTFIAALAVVACLVLSHFSDALSRLVFQTAQYRDEFMLIFVSLALELCTSVAFTYLRILEKSVLYIGIYLLQIAIGLGLNIYFIVVRQWGIHGILYSMVISNGVACALLLVYAFSKVRFGFDLSKLRQLLEFGLPMVPAGILIFVLNMGDRFLLNRLGNLSEVGIYALGYKFGMMVGTFIGGPFSFIWAPKRVEIYKERANRDEIFSRVFTYIFFVLALGGLAISLLIKEVLTLIAAPEFWPAYRVVPLVVLGYNFYILYYIVDFGFYIKNKTYWYLIINGVAAAVNVGLNLLLIPRFGAMGAAWVTALSFFICPLMAFVISQRYYPLRYDIERIAKLTVMILVFYWIGSSVATGYLLADILLKTLVVLAIPILLYLIGFFDTRELSFLKDRWLKLKRLEFSL
jgi:O-antigen/teichoic acid export membrane protein